MKRIVFILVCLFSCCRILIAQDIARHQVKGEIYFPEGKKVRYSLFILDGVETNQAYRMTQGIDPVFSYAVPEKEHGIILFIQAEGYKKYTKKVPKFTSDIDFGRILMEPEEKELKEVLVEGKKPVVVDRGAKTHIQVEHTMLSEAGSLLSLMRRLPQLEVRGQQIRVLDSDGKPVVIVLNDKEIKDSQLLEVLQSRDIKKIEIDRDPEVYYAGKVLIRITTARPLTDYLFWDVTGNYEQSHQVSGGAGSNVRLKLGKFSSGLSYSYKAENRLRRGEEYRLMPSDGSEFNLVDKYKSLEHQGAHKLLFTTDYDLNKKTQLSLLYSYIHGEDKDDEEVDRLTKTPLWSKSFELYNKEHRQSNTHNLSLGYIQKIGEGNDRFTAQLDLARVDGATHYLNRERPKGQSLWQREVESQTQNTYSLLDAHMSYAFSSVLGYTTLGVKYAQVSTPTSYLIDDESLLPPDFVRSTKTREQTLQGYIDLQKWFTPKFMAHIGLKYDYTQMALDYRTSTSQHYKKGYHNILPTLKLAYVPKNRMYLSLDFSIPFLRPRFSDLLPITNYKESMVYERGTPEVKVAKSYQSWLSFYYGNFRAVAVWGYLPYFYFRTYERLSPNSYVMTSSLQEYSHYNAWSLMLTYNKQWNTGWSLALALNNYYRPYFQDAKLKRYQYHFYNRLRGGYMKGSLHLWGEVSYENAVANDLQWVEGWGWNFQLGLTMMLLKDKLTLDLILPNITRSTTPDNYIINGGMKWGERNINQDPRYVEVSLRYKLYNKQIRINASQGNEENLDRVL